MQAKSCPQVFQEIFGGAFLDQKICKGCNHTYDREESFLSLSLPVKSKKQLDESLKEFVKGDWLEGDNAYFCEKCKEKRDTLKRTCIKTLPPVLVVHLKRFDYDWEAGRAIKYDDYFEVGRVGYEIWCQWEFCFELCSFHGFWTWSLLQLMVLQGKSKKGKYLQNSSCLSLLVLWSTQDKLLQAITTHL